MSEGFFRNRPGRSLLIVSSLLFAILVVRLFSLQVAGRRHYRALSEENRIQPVSLRAQRGLILDRAGRILAENRPSYAITLMPSGAQDAQETMERLNRLIGLDGGRADREFGRRRRPVNLVRDASFEIISIVEEHRNELPGVKIETESRRAYPLEMYASHVIGYMGEMAEHEEERLYSKGYVFGQWIGRDGIEREYEDLLRGTNGIEYREVTAAGREIGTLSEGRVPPRPGQDVQLSLDIDLQCTAENSFPDTSMGALVALDPRNGEILAMVSRPNFDPGLFSSLMSPEMWGRMANDPRKPLLNRAVRGQYPPASTLKMVTATAALDLGSVGKRWRAPACTGALDFGNRSYGCWREEGHGSLDLIQAIAQSCDVFFYHLGRRVGLERWSRCARAFEFGRRTGVDLPREESGLVPSKEYYDRRYGEWTQGLMLNLAIGQGEMLATPLQMARHVGAICTEGYLAQPHLLLRKGPASSYRSTHSSSVRGVSAETLRIMRRAMLETVEGEKGTAKGARIPGHRVAGKTGTAQNPHGEDHSWFVGFAPFEQPTIAIAVVVEHGGPGSGIATFIAREVLEVHLSGAVAVASRNGESQTVCE